MPPARECGPCTKEHTYAARVWALCLVQGPLSLSSPCQILIRPIRPTLTRVVVVGGTLHRLGWKLTISGVGQCRQVGCPESGVDAAAAKLVSRGHKVGLIEQLGSVAEAKAKGGSKAIVERRLVKVLTPATLVDSPVSDAAVHVLAVAQHTSVLAFAFMDAAAGRCGPNH
jgi:hypothetical protein